MYKKGIRSPANESMKMLEEIHGPTYTVTQSTAHLQNNIPAPQQIYNRKNGKAFSLRNP